MKFFLPFLFLLFSASSLTAQNYRWALVGGDITVEQQGVYGVKGLASAANKPGARQDAVTWTDAAGNLWLFGGYGQSATSTGYLGDLWKYTPSTGQWTWVSGDNAVSQYGVYGTRGVPGNDTKPGSRESATGWTDAMGNLWLFGGVGYAASGTAVLNDLWKFTPLTGQWTWMSGDITTNEIGVYGTRGVAAPGNKPGARSSVARWTDASGNFWLLGGVGYASNGTQGVLNDFWKFVPATGTWTWMGGDNVVNQLPVYGSRGVASATNKPGARYAPGTWADNAGNLWMFGGWGYSVPNGFGGEMNEMWKYSIATGQWTWVRGNVRIDPFGTYGVKGVANPVNEPGGRQDVGTWIDPAGNLWFFSGGGLTSSDGGPTNDVWKFDPVRGWWTWVAGDVTAYHIGIYGTRGVPDSANKPGTRLNPATWIDPSGNFWAFGGTGDNSTSNGLGTRQYGRLNDLWRYSSAPPSLTGQVATFTAQKEEQSVQLSWTTGVNPPSGSFIVERSLGGAVYDSIGTVTASGIGASGIVYRFTDPAPSRQSTNYYRLRQRDVNGSVSYSAIARVVMEQAAGRYGLMQNPVPGSLLLWVELSADEPMTLQVRDMNGLLLISEQRTGTQGRAVYSVPVSRLAKGNYVLQIQSRTISSAKIFVKQ